MFVPQKSLCLILAKYISFEVFFPFKVWAVLVFIVYLAVQPSQHRMIVNVKMGQCNLKMKPGKSHLEGTVFSVVHPVSVSMLQHPFQQ